MGTGDLDLPLSFWHPKPFPAFFAFKITMSLSHAVMKLKCLPFKAKVFSFCQEIHVFPSPLFHLSGQYPEIGIDQQSVGNQRQQNPMYRNTDQQKDQ